MNIAQRNRALKALLEKTYVRGNVRVRGSTGTAYGWVRVKITTPLAYEARPTAWQEEYARVERLVREAGVEMYHFSEWRTPCMNIDF